MSFAIGADVGGTKMSVVMTTREGIPVHEIWVQHSFSDAPALLESLERAVQECRSVAKTHGTPIDAFGLSLAAWLNRSREHVVLGANLGLAGIDLKDLLQQKTGFETIVIENDGDATAWGEYRFGAGRDSATMALFSIGTGVGGGVIHDGRIFRGSNGLGGELGHIRIDGVGAECCCGSSGCLELLASGRALDSAALRLRESGESAWLVRHRPQVPVSAKDLATAAHEGDPAALEAFDQTAAAIAAAISTIVPVIDPDVIVVGGSVTAGAGDILLPLVEKHHQALHTLGMVRKPQPIQAATLGPIAAAIGAADAARQFN